MWVLALVLGLALIASVYINVVLPKRLLQYQTVFETVDEFVSLIYSFTIKFEGKPLLTDSPEAVHLHKLISLTRDFFRGFELEERKETDDG